MEKERVNLCLWGETNAGVEGLASLSSGLSDAPWLNRRRPGSLYSIIEYEEILLLLLLLLLVSKNWSKKILICLAPFRDKMGLKSSIANCLLVQKKCARGTFPNEPPTGIEP